MQVGHIKELKELKFIQEESKLLFLHSSVEESKIDKGYFSDERFNCIIRNRFIFAEKKKKETRESCAIDRGKLQRVYFVARV